MLGKGENQRFLIEDHGMDNHLCYVALEKTFRVRNTHQLPAELKPPPDQWIVLFEAMASECGLDTNMNAAYEKVDKFYQKVIEIAQ